MLSPRFHAPLALWASLLALGVASPDPPPSPASPQPATRRALDDQGVFVLSLAGRPVGTEKFEIRASEGRIEAKAEIELRLEQNRQPVALQAFPALIMDSEFEPVTYNWSQRGAQSSELTVDFRASPAKCRYRTMTGQQDYRDFNLPKGVVVLDDNVIHHFQVIVDRLKPPGAGRQNFKAFVPQEGLPGDLTVEDVPDAPATKLRHLRVSTELTHIDLWVDEQERLERVSNPEAQFEAIRQR